MGSIAAVLVGSLSTVDGKAQAGGLFLELESSVAALETSSNSVTTLRARLVGIDVGRLAAVRSDVGRAGVPPQTLTLNLFDDVVFWPSSKRAPGQPLDTPCLVGSRGQTAVRSP